MRTFISPIVKYIKYKHASTTFITESIISTYFHYSYHREHYLYLLPLLLPQRALSLLTSTTLITESIISTYFHYSYHREHYLGIFQFSPDLHA